MMAPAAAAGGGGAPVCEPCGNPACGAGAAARRCGRCRAYFYCDAACQRAHWRAGHKDECAMPAPAVAPRAEAAVPGVAPDDPYRCAGAGCAAFPRRACAGCGLAFVCARKRCVRLHRAACTRLLTGERRTAAIVKRYAGYAPVSVGKRSFAAPLSVGDVQEMMDLAAAAPGNAARFAEKFGAIAAALRARAAGPDGLDPAQVAAYVEAARWSIATALSTNVRVPAAEVRETAHGLGLFVLAPVPAGHVVSEFGVSALACGRGVMGPVASALAAQPLAMEFLGGYRNRLSARGLSGGLRARALAVLAGVSAVFRRVLEAEPGADPALIARETEQMSTIADPAVGGPGVLAHLANDAVDLALLAAVARAGLRGVSTHEGVPRSFFAVFRRAYGAMAAVQRNNALIRTVVDDLSATLRTVAVASRDLAAGEEVLVAYGWRYWIVPAVREAYPELGAQLAAPAFTERVRAEPVV